MEEIRRSTVEVGSLIISFTKVLYIPGGARSLPSTVILIYLGTTPPGLLHL